MERFAIEKLQRRGITVADVEGLLDGRPVRMVRNKKNRVAGYRLIGEGQGGQLITVCLKLTSREECIWRPVTGWLATHGERIIWRGKRQ